MRSFFIFLFIFFPFTLCFADEKAQVKEIRYYDLPNGIRAVVEINKEVEFSTGKLKNPERLFFDLKPATVNRDLKKEYLTNNNLIYKIRLGQFDSNTVRVVFELQTSEYEFKLLKLDDPFRIVIDVYIKSSSKSQIHTEESKKSSSETKTTKQAFKRTVVIDPGHGGKDSGAVGPTGLMEKDVVLDIALKVKELFKTDPQYNVILTRDKDIFIPLNERTEIANRAGADLFVSIHANASANSYAKGIETYILNWTDDEEAIRVAARENAISVKKMRQLKGELGFMLASLEREAKRDDSVKLAGYIHTRMTEALKNSFSRSDNGVKQALFYVLVGAQMPSCLLEVSYISNPEEERLLADEYYRMKIAQSIVNGIKDYFSRVEKIQKVKYTKHSGIVRVSSKKAGIKSSKLKKF